MSDIGLDQLITVDEALGILSVTPAVARTVTVQSDGSLGCVLAADVVSDRAYPPADKSLMDGYAVRAIDTAGGATLCVVSEVAAGVTAARLNAGEAVAIMTGGFVPAGADAVVPVERVERRGDTVRVPEISAGKAIARRGSDGAAGQIVLRAGQTIGPRQRAVAATVGAQELLVYAAPRVGVLVTGDEIVPRHPGPAAAAASSPAKLDTSSASGPLQANLQTRDANGPMLLALLELLGCEAVDLGHARDDVTQLRSAFTRAAGLDVLFVCGGISMGRYDFVPGVMRDAGYVARISKLKIRPGKPFVFGVKNDADADVFAKDMPPFIFGLPGNPVSGYVCVMRLATRLLRRLGASGAAERWVELPLAEPLAANGPREAYIPATFNAHVVTPLRANGSADVFTLSAADVLIQRPENDPAKSVGETVRCLEIL